MIRWLKFTYWMIYKEDKNFIKSWFKHYLLRICNRAIIPISLPRFVITIIKSDVARCRLDFKEIQLGMELILFNPVTVRGDQSTIWRKSRLIYFFKNLHNKLYFMLFVFFLNIAILYWLDHSFKYVIQVCS
jgi:hypothetical protein